MSPERITFINKSFDSFVAYPVGYFKNPGCRKEGLITKAACGLEHWRTPRGRAICDKGLGGVQKLVR